MTALEILKQKKVLKQDFDPKKPFQLNLTRDGHKKSIEDILSAMEIFAEQEAKAYASWLSNTVIQGRTASKLWADYKAEVGINLSA